MSSDSVSNEIKGFVVNFPVLNSIIQSVENCLQMCALTSRVVGVSKIPTHLSNAPVTGIIGLSGKCTGFISVTMSERVALQAVAGLTGDDVKQITSQVLDGVGELTNMIAGGLKTKLYNTNWTIADITIPSVILGTHYDISYAKGIDFCSVSFEIDIPGTLTIGERVFCVSTSLLQTQK